MGARIDIKARRDLVRPVSERYRHASKEDRRRILDQFVAITSCHRKHSIRLLNSTAALTAPRQATRFRVYDEAVKQALIVLWEASDCICGKRQKGRMRCTPLEPFDAQLQLEQKAAHIVRLAPRRRIREQRIASSPC